MCKKNPWPLGPFLILMIGGKVVCEQRVESGERRAEVEEQKIDIWKAILR